MGFTSHITNHCQFAIKLDIPADEAEKYYQDYVRLSDFAYLQDIISDNGDLRPFLTLYNVLKSLDVSFDNLDENINRIKKYRHY